MSRAQRLQKRPDSKPNEQTPHLRGTLITLRAGMRLLSPHPCHAQWLAMPSTSDSRLATVRS